MPIPVLKLFAGTNWIWLIGQGVEAVWLVACFKAIPWPQVRRRCTPHKWADPLNFGRFCKLRTRLFDVSGNTPGKSAAKPSGGKADILPSWGLKGVLNQAGKKICTS